jgi:hypothetical protein
VGSPERRQLPPVLAPDTFGDVTHEPTIGHAAVAANAAAAVTYAQHDGSRVTLPCVNAFRLRDGRVADYRIYVDSNPSSRQAPRRRRRRGRSVSTMTVSCAIPTSEPFDVAVGHRHPSKITGPPVRFMLSSLSNPDQRSG